MSTPVEVSAAAGEIAILREQALAVHRVVRGNTSGFTEEDSLIQPQPGGNCLNWVVGHLLFTYDSVLPALGQEPVLGVDALRRYERGSAPLTDPGKALPLETLLNAWDAAWKRVDAGLIACAPERLDEPAPFSPRRNPDESIRSLLTMVLFHQAYHAGQTGLLRRIAGKEGAIK